MALPRPCRCPARELSKRGRALPRHAKALTRLSWEPDKALPTNLPVCQASPARACQPRAETLRGEPAEPEAAVSPAKCMYHTPKVAPNEERRFASGRQRAGSLRKPAHAAPTDCESELSNSKPTSLKREALQVLPIGQRVGARNRHPDPDEQTHSSRAATAVG